MTHNDINTDIRLVAAKMGRLLDTIEGGTPVAMDERFTTPGGVRAGRSAVGAAPLGDAGREQSLTERAERVAVCGQTELTGRLRQSRPRHPPHYLAHQVQRTTEAGGGSSDAPRRWQATRGHRLRPPPREPTGTSG